MKKIRTVYRIDFFLSFMALVKELISVAVVGLVGADKQSQLTDSPINLVSNSKPL
jgi:hypothetical protein